MELIIALLIVHAAIAASFAAFLASQKGKNVGAWAILGLIFGIIAVIAIAGMPINDTSSKLLHTRVCPYCVKSIHESAKVCPYCQRESLPTRQSEEVRVKDVSYIRPIEHHKYFVDIVLTLVNKNDELIQGASISIEVLDEHNDVVTTVTAKSNKDGKATYYFYNSRSKSYSTRISEIKGRGLIWDGITPPNQFINDT